MEKLTRGRPRAPAGCEKRVHPTQHTSLQQFATTTYLIATQISTMSLCQSCISIPFRALQRGEYPPGWKKDSWVDENGQPWGCDSHIWTCNRRQSTLSQLREDAVNCVLCSMLIHGLENRPTYKRLSQEMDLDVTPVWLLLPGSEGIYNQKLELHLEQQTPHLESPVEATAVEFRSRFGM